MKSATSLTPPSTGLSGIQFTILNVLESLILKDQIKYNNTEMKVGQLFTAATQHLTPAVVNIKYWQTIIQMKLYEHNLRHNQAE